MGAAILVGRLVVALVVYAEGLAITVAVGKELNPAGPPGKVAPNIVPMPMPIPCGWANPPPTMPGNPT
eukprot:CAMPEP_0173399092 /NCGR_PEP_ID=MMETSP1356-20130122/43940_1 /TAXON_ID=77927 ORGANISM="Hemiselmis virescens, Strain PCC157" /NCGR_SAMPLE_ID=MMETSP1356 /ASSEMBLY_ACC=CAM_ASM_000847 /LENGTH=67 /DNA_ID=CAMNT_0014358741 /DNA_START=77 /DNA_END=276 /DNA_ORIENTATION=-